MRMRDNFVSGTLDGSLTDSDLSATLTGLSAFNAPLFDEDDDFYIPITIDPLGENNGPEIVHVTEAEPDAATPDDSVVIVRGREGTTAVAHSDGDSWVHAPTLHDFYPPCNPRSHGDEDDEFISTELDADWTKVEPTTTSTFSPGQGALSIYNPGGMAASEFGGMVKSFGAGTGAFIETKVSILAAGNGTGSYHPAGLVFTDGSTHGAGGQISFNFALNTSSGLTYVALRRWNNWNAYSTQQSQAQIWTDSHELWIRLGYVSANTWRAQYSLDGISWVRAVGQTSDWSNTLTPTHCGLWWSDYGASNNMSVVFDHFRIYDIA